MSDWFEWRGENFYAVHGKQLWYVGCVIRRTFEDKWDVWARGEHMGVFVSEAAAKRRVEEIVKGTRPVYRGPARSRSGAARSGQERSGAARSGQEPRWKFNG